MEHRDTVMTQRKGAAGQQLSDFESNTIAVTETKTVFFFLRRRAQVGVEETRLGGHFSLESIAWVGDAGEPRRETIERCLLHFR